jgi:GT2 family glycosyltransferase
MPKVAISILNYNGLKLLQTYLPIVTQHHPLNEIFIIDNASTDESVQWLNSNYPEIKIIRHQENLGFTRGYNEGLKHIQADYYVLMNNDIRTTENWLLPVLELMESRSDIAVCMPKLLDDKNPEYFEYAGASGGFLDVLAYPFCRGRIFLELEKDVHQYDDEREIFWATGACMVVRASTFWEAGGFDDDFFAHMEEIDLCWRLLNMGYKIYVQPKSKVYHLGGGTLNKINPQKTYLNFRNSLITLLKNHPKKKLCWKIFLRLVLDGVAGIKFLLEGNGKHTLSVIQAHFYFYKHFRKFWNKRKIFDKQHRINYTFSPTYRKSIVLQHYVFGKKKFSQLGKLNFES